MVHPFNSISGSWVRYPVWQHTFISPSAFSRRAVVSYWRKYVHEVLVKRFGGLSLPRKSVVRLTDRPDMTLDVYHEHKTTMQQQQQQYFSHIRRSVSEGFLTYSYTEPLGLLKSTPYHHLPHHNTQTVEFVKKKS